MPAFIAPVLSPLSAAGQAAIRLIYSLPKGTIVENMNALLTKAGAAYDIYQALSAVADSDASKYLSYLYKRDPSLAVKVRDKLVLEKAAPPGLSMGDHEIDEVLGTDVEDFSKSVMQIQAARSNIKWLAAKLAIPQRDVVELAYRLQVVEPEHQLLIDFD
jgi:hypothetical protein